MQYSAQDLELLLLQCIEYQGSGQRKPAIIRLPLIYIANYVKYKHGNRIAMIFYKIEYKREI